MNALTIVYSVLFCVYLSNGQNSSCSIFDHDKCMLEMMVRIEADVKQKNEKQNTMEQELNNLQKQLADSISEIQELKKSLQSQDTRVNLEDKLDQSREVDGNY